MIDLKKKQLFDQATKLYTTISLPGDLSNWVDCFTIYDNELLFWFNDKTNSTRLLTATIEN